MIESSTFYHTFRDLGIAMFTLRTTSVYVVCGPEMLLIRRSKDDENKASWWEAPAGHVDIPCEAQDSMRVRKEALRELFEETGISADPYLLELLKYPADQILEKIRSEHDLLKHIEQIIESNLKQGRLSAETVAFELNISVRKLRRLLQEKNTTYRELRDIAIIREAKQALSDTKASVTEISQQLGYSESSAFVRIFKQREGVSPLKFRKNLHHSKR